MLQAPTQAFLAETEGGEITENHKIRELFYIFESSSNFLSKFST